MASVERIVSKTAAPAAGPYSHAVKAGGSLWISGQIPAHPNGDLVEGSIGDKTRACIVNLKAIAEESGSGLDKIVKCTVFLTDMAYFNEVNEEYIKWFGDMKPARSCIAVKQLPKGVPVEIEAVAVV